MRLPVSLVGQSFAVLGAAGLCAVVSNAVAGPTRHLGWTTAPMAAAPVAPLQVEPPLLPGLPSSTQPAPPAVPQPSKVHLSSPAPEISVTIPSPRPSQPVREITSTEAWAAFQKGAAFLDARRSADFEAGHIQGAFSLPVWESTLDERLVEFEAKANRPPEAPLVLYCSGGSCEDSHLLASRLFQMGYRHLLIYRDGYPDWQAQGRPVVMK
ncbi:MAG: rhodanese-like domain-containing protein [Holophaga sp.]|nr:rhodanese-like domain-containing protein [Holophaga sp.]